jgi:glycosyltransferase involved in cell wall biosynthesis
VTPRTFAITVDPYIPVPPAGYGGFERVVDLLVRGLVARGHRVTLLAHPGSRVPAELISYGTPPHWGLRPRLTELAAVAGTLLKLAPEIDLVHSFGRLAALLPILPMRRLPKIQSYGREIPWRGVRRAARLAGESLWFTGCSTSLYAGGGPTAGRWVTVYNPVDTSLYTPTASVPADAPLMFLGRVEAIKGAHNAIAIARAAGRRLIIAGNVADRQYFDAEVAPHLGAGVRFVGEVNDAQKNALLGEAAALLMPIEWDEPFGIVMIEALACGTPVIGYRRGSVPEVIVEGTTGFIVDTVCDAVAAVARLGTIDRGACRRDVERRFAADVIVNEYERLYDAALGG